MKEYFDLVIIRDDAIGDYILWHDAISAYQETYKGKRILLICDDRLKELAEQEDAFAKVMCFNRNKIIHNRKYLLSYLIKLRYIRTDKLIYPSWTQRAIGATFVFFIKAKNKIGMCGFKGDNISLWKSIYRKIGYLQFDELVSYPNTKSEIRIIEHFTREVIKRDYKYGNHPLKIKEVSFDIPSKYVFFSLSASGSRKVWGMKNFAAVIDRIPSEYNVVISGVGDEDVKRASVIKGTVIDKTRLIDMVNKTSVLEMASLISKASFVLGNDSSAVHIAAATRVPSICVLHGAHFNRFLPYPEDLPFPYYNPRAVYYEMDCYGCCYQCDKPKDDVYYCLKQVTKDMVIKELNKLIQDIRNHELYKSN